MAGELTLLVETGGLIRPDASFNEQGISVLAIQLIQGKYIRPDGHGLAGVEYGTANAQALE